MGSIISIIVVLRLWGPPWCKSSQTVQAVEIPSAFDNSEAFSAVAGLVPVSFSFIFEFFSQMHSLDVPIEVPSVGKRTLCAVVALVYPMSLHALVCLPLSI